MPKTCSIRYLTLPPQRGKLRLILPFLLGQLCGFPVGAKVCADLYRKGILSEKEAKGLLFSAGGASPAFTVNLIGQGVFHSAFFGWALWAGQVCFGAASLAIFLWMRKEKKAPSPIAPPEKNTPFLSLFVRCTGDGLAAFFTIGSFVLFFSFVSQILLSLCSAASPGVKAGVSLFFELCGGAEKLKALPPQSAVFPAAAFLGFGGVSALLQAKNVLSSSKLSFTSYFAGRLAAALFLPLFALFFKNLL